MAEYRSLTKREPIYLNVVEAELIKKGLYGILMIEEEERDLICDLIHELNGCIHENIWRHEQDGEVG